MGALIMSHSDDKGFSCPPAVAPIQVAIVCIWKKETDKTAVADAAREMKARLTKKGYRVELDDRDGIRPGAKYYEWERKVSYPLAFGHTQNTVLDRPFSPFSLLLVRMQPGEFWIRLFYQLRILF